MKRLVLATLAVAAIATTALATSMSSESARMLLDSTVSTVAELPPWATDSRVATHAETPVLTISSTPAGVVIQIR